MLDDCRIKVLKYHMKLRLSLKSFVYIRYTFNFEEEKHYAS